MTDVPEEERVAAVIKQLRADEGRRLLGDSMSAAEILTTLAADDPATFAREVLPVARQASSASRSGHESLNGERDVAFGMAPFRDPGYNANEALLVRLTEAVRAAAGAGDPKIHTAVRDMAGSPLATEQRLAAAGFASGHPDLLTDAAQWLLTGPYALDQGWGDDWRALSADALFHVCTQMTEDQTRGIQERAAAHTTPYEREQRHELYGATAWRLLRDIPDAKLTETVRRRKSELDRKFSTPAAAAAAVDAPGDAMDIFVRPPISDTAVEKMTDEHLVNAMRRWSGNDWEPELSGHLRGGASSFAQVLAAAAQEAPARFTAILESLPSDIQPVYTTQILFGLSKSATPEQSLRAVWATRGRIGTSGVQIGWLLERAAPYLDAALLTAAGLTEDDLFGLLAQILAQPSAQPADVAEGKGDSTGDEPERAAGDEVTGMKVAERLMSRAMNRPEYAAVRTLAVLGPRFPRAASLLSSQLDHLASSRALAVRAMVIEMSLTQIAAGPAAVTDVAVKALDSNGVAADPHPEPLPADRRILLGSFQLRNLLLRLCRPHHDITAPFLDRMISFYDTAAAGDSPPIRAAADLAAQNAAMIAAVAASQHPEPLVLTQQLAERELPFRRGITAALTQLLPLGDMPDEMAAILVQLFDDTDDDLARLAGGALMHLPAGNDDLASRLLSAASQAKTFTLQPAQIVTAADQYHGNISRTLLEIAKRFFTLHQSQASDLRGSGAHSASVLGRIVVGIYAQESQDSPLSIQTLNLIDDMVLARSYGLEEQLARLDR